MLAPSLSRSPRLAVTVARSDPAKSIRDSLALLTYTQQTVTHTWTERRREGLQIRSFYHHTHTHTHTNLCLHPCSARFAVDIDLEHSVRARGGGIGLSWVLGAVLVAKLQHSQQLLCIPGL